MSQKVLSDLDFVSVSKILNLPDPTSAQHAATKSYVDSKLEGLAWKDDVRVATASNINLASPGAALDGVTMAVNDRVLVMGQTAPAENGIYVYNGAATPLSRSFDAQVGSDLLEAVTTVSEGTSASASFRQNSINITIGTTAVVWNSFGTVAPAATTSTPGIAALATQSEVDAGSVTNKIVTPATLAAYAGLLHKYSAAIGDGSATSYVVTHNLNSRDVQISVYRATSPFDTVMVDVERTSTTTATIRFGAAPSSNAYRVVVVG